MTCAKHVHEEPVHDDITYGRYALRTGTPWITPNSLAVLDTLVKPDWHVFEWGAGGSTIYWTRKCAHVTSVEHNSEWITRVKEMFVKFGVDASKVELVYKRGLPEDQKDRFRPYADVILDYPDESFDLVFVDGEASSRGWCLTNALTKVKPGGVLLLDNSDWLKRDLSDEWQRTDYVVKDLKWIGQPGTFDWWTSILVKMGGCE